LRAADHRPIHAALAAGEEVLGEVEYAEATRDGVLRHPVFKGVRTDVDAAACTVDQLGR
jgi:ATP-dependent DNA ligase